MDYCVVTVNQSNYYEATKKLQERVKALCDKGWKPQGGVSISVYTVGYHNMATMSQAMIKDDKPHESEESNYSFPKNKVIFES